MKRVACLGGGPAGLYAAILLRKALPRARIEVYERNRPDDTFGWGVVFSDQTMDNFRLADAESHADIVGSFHHWDDIEVHFRGEVLRSGGHGFCGIARKRLLNILQERAAGLGVDLHFERDIDDDAAFADADLVIGSDGVNSRVRARHEHPRVRALLVVAEEAVLAAAADKYERPEPCDKRLLRELFAHPPEVADRDHVERLRPAG